MAKSKQVVVDSVETAVVSLLNKEGTNHPLGKVVTLDKEEAKWVERHYNNARQPKQKGSADRYYLKEEGKVTKTKLVWQPHIGLDGQPLLPVIVLEQNKNKPSFIGAIIGATRCEGLSQLAWTNVWDWVDNEPQVIIYNGNIDSGTLLRLSLDQDLRQRKFNYVDLWQAYRVLRVEYDYNHKKACEAIGKGSGDQRLLHLWHIRDYPQLIERNLNPSNEKEKVGNAALKTLATNVEAIQSIDDTFVSTDDKVDAILNPTAKAATYVALTEQMCQRIVKNLHRFPSNEELTELILAMCGMNKEGETIGSGNKLAGKMIDKLG
jgi:hypothetical protein